MSLPTSQVQQHPASVDAYIRHGWSLVPIPQGTKGPRTQGWNKRENALKDQSELPSGYGIGLAHAYSGTCALDIDNWTTSAFVLGLQGIDIQALYDAPDAVIIDSGKAGRGKLLYAMPIPLRTKKIITSGETTYELRCATASGLTVQDVLPPSIHPETNQPYRWAGRGHWTRLPSIPEVLLHHWQSIIDRDNDTTVVNASGAVEFSWTDMHDALFRIPPDIAREQWINVGMALHWAGVQVARTDDALLMWDEWSQGSAEKYPGKREIITQWKSFKADKESGVKLGTLFHLALSYGYRPPEPDVTKLFESVNQSPKQLMDMLRPPPPDLNLEDWPDPLAARANEVSTSIGCDPLVSLLAGIGAVCAVVDARTRLEILPGYKVPPVLWLMTVGEPGDKKSPGARPMMSLLREIELEDRERFAKDRLDWEAQEAMYAASKKAFLEAAASPEAVLGGELPEVEELSPSPVPVKLTVSDITSQKLVRTIADRPRGVLCYLDEMNSWVRKMTDRGSGEDRSTWVVGYEAEPYSMERVGSGSIHADNFAVSVYGNIQPAIYREAIRALGSDGMLQRFIPAVLRRRRWETVQPIPEFLSSKAKYETMLRTVYAMPAMTYRLSEPALAKFKQFQSWYEDVKWNERICGAPDLFMTAFGKLEGTLGRLILIQHLVENPFSVEVPESTVNRCVNFVKNYLIPSYRYVFGDFSGVDTLDTWVTEYIVIHADKQTISISDISRGARRQTGEFTANEFRLAIIAAMDLLQAVGWVKRLDDGRIRDNANWAINPQLAEQFESQRRTIKEAKDKLMAEFYRTNPHK